MSSVRSYGLLLLMSVAALAAAVWLVVGPEPPTPVNLALFLILLILAATGLLTPPLAVLHRRLPLGGRPPTPTAATRQAFLLGLGLALAGWLQLARLLDGTLCFGIVALVVLIEVLVQSRG